MAASRRAFGREVVGGSSSGREGKENEGSVLGDRRGRDGGKGIVVG